MGRKAKHLRLTVEEDDRLRELEQHAQLGAKVRLRAQVVRLSANGWTIPRIAEHVRRHPESVRHDLLRWERQGIAGLADGVAPGKPLSITLEMEQLLRTKLSEERIWDCAGLGDAIYEAFGVRVGREALRARLHVMGYRWKRTRYVPAHAVDPELEAKAREELEELKKGPLKASSP